MTEGAGRLGMAQGLDFSGGGRDTDDEKVDLRRRGNKHTQTIEPACFTHRVLVTSRVFLQSAITVERQPGVYAVIMSPRDPFHRSGAKVRSDSR